MGDPVSVSAARLDEAGAALADAALKGNALPTVVIFELETLGLSGPLGVTAEADLQAIHDRLTAEGALTTPYGRARIAKTWESAARDNLIRIRVVDETGDVESQRAEAMRRVGEDLLSRMFSPFPPPERPRQLDDGTVVPIELSFRLTVRRKELATSSRWDFRERRAVTIKHYAAASLIDLLGDRGPADHITFADLSEIQREAVIRAEPELMRLGLAALEVDLRHAGAASIRQTVVLTDAQPELRVGLRIGDRFAAQAVEGLVCARTLVHLAQFLEPLPAAEHAGLGTWLFWTRTRQSIFVDLRDPLPEQALAGLRSVLSPEQRDRLERVHSGSNVAWPWSFRVVADGSAVRRIDVHWLVSRHASPEHGPRRSRPAAGRRRCTCSGTSCAGQAEAVGGCS